MSRIYLVERTTGNEPARLIRAPNQAQAIRHAVADTFRAVVASQDDLVLLVGQGVSVEDIPALTAESAAAPQAD